MKLLRYLAIAMPTLCTGANAQTLPDKSRSLRIITPFGGASDNH